MALVILAMVAFGARNLSSMSERASDIIEHRDMAAVSMARATRSIILAPYSIFGDLIYENNSPEGNVADEQYPKAIASAEAFFDEAMTFAPQKSSDISEFKKRFQTIMEQSKAPMKIAQATSGLATGSKLTSGELDQMAEAAHLLAKDDTEVRALNADIVVFNTAFLMENAQAAADLRAQSNSALVTMLIVGTVSTLLAGLLRSGCPPPRLPAHLAV